MTSGHWSPLRSELDGLSQTAKQGLERTRFHMELRAAIQRYLWTPAMVLGVFVILQVIGRLLQWSPLQSSWALWLGIALLVFVLRFVRYLGASRQRSIDRAHAIGEWDFQLHLADRLTAADDFLNKTSRTAFMEAALQDAGHAIERTRQSRLQFETQPWHKNQLIMPALAAALLLMTGYFAGDWHTPNQPAATTLSVELPGGQALVEALRESDSQPHQNAQHEDLREKQNPADDRAAVAETRAYASEVAEKSKQSEGKTGNGRSAAAESSTGAGSSQGTPSQQGQISKPGKEKTKAKRKPASKQKPHQQEDPPQKNEEQESGATAGRGSSRGSNRNPASSDWSSKDHVNTPDDDNLEEEEETEDEEEEQEARGGMQPSLRDRRPPVSRDLMIGFGNQPHPAANGRGGPAPPKKSRGTASLVLGVPIPDRVKGQPNPGKTKITQERVQPKSEPAIAVDAQKRQQRVAPGSALQRQELEPWMRSLVRDYFLAQRQKVKKP
jgi:hypothetical protein